MASGLAGYSFCHRARMYTILLLLASNVFMTVAWYWQLSSHRFACGTIILLSWLIALPEYALAVPANRIGL